MMGLCKGLNLRISISINDDTRYGEGLRRAYKFLDEAGDYKIDNAHWQELEKIRKIRNRLVHEGGILMPKPTANGTSVKIDLGDDGVIYFPIDSGLYSYLAEHELYSLGKSRFTPNFDYCKHLIDFGTVVLTKIYQHFNLAK